MVLLLVDDDQIMLEGMPVMFPWKEWGITKLCTAWSVRQAKTILMKEKVDILLCDIEMPMGTGIELITWVNEKISTPMVKLILTCHSEFRYAQQAISLGCSGYLLKPVTGEELEPAIAKAREALGDGADRKSGNEKGEYRREAFWETLFMHNIRGGETLKRTCMEYKVRTDLLVCLMLLSVRHCSERIREMRKNLISFVLENVARETLQDTEFSLVNDNGGNIYLFYEKAALEQGREVIFNGISHVLSWMKEKYYCFVSCYVGHMVEVREWARECEYLMEKKEHLAASPRIFMPEEMDRKIRFPFKISEELLDYLSTLFSGRKTEAFLSALEDYLEQNTQYCDVAALRELVVCLDRKLEQADGAKVGNVRRRLAREGMGDLDSFPAVLEYYERMLSVLEQEEKRKEEGATERVKQYVKDHLSRQLNRNELGELVGLNPDYLNRVFKRETGVALKDYVADQKIERACELLTDTDLKIGDIGEMVGYGNFSSFTTFFKNRTGMTPTAFRKEYKK